MPPGMRLGDHKDAKPTGGTRARMRALPRRPDVTDDGVTFEVVWYPHRDAPTLLPGYGYQNRPQG